MNMGIKNSGEFLNNRARFNNTKPEGNIININDLKLQLQGYPKTATHNKVC